jgi:hypothetical protein
MCRERLAAQTLPTVQQPECVILSTFKLVLFQRPSVNLYSEEARLFLAGFCARGALKEVMCKDCRKVFAEETPMRVDCDKDCGLDIKYIRNMDRGGLTYPTPQTLAVASAVMAVFANLIRCAFPFQSAFAASARIFSFSKEKTLSLLRQSVPKRCKSDPDISLTGTHTHTHVCSPQFLRAFLDFGDHRRVVVTLGLQRAKMDKEHGALFHKHVQCPSCHTEREDLCTRAVMCMTNVLCSNYTKMRNEQHIMGKQEERYANKRKRESMGIADTAGTSAAQKKVCERSHICHCARLYCHKRNCAQTRPGVWQQVQ